MAVVVAVAYRDAVKCPGCKSDMAVIEVHSIEIDRCPSCGGIVLDKGENDSSIRSVSLMSSRAA